MILCFALVVAAAGVGIWPGASARDREALDRDARRWVERSLTGMSVADLAGQMVFGRVDSTYLSSDSDTYEALTRLVQEGRVGGFVAFGGEEPFPSVKLNPTYGPIVLGQPLELASTLNRLQGVARVPLLMTTDFEWGAAMRVSGTTRFPRAMAFGAAGDARLGEQAGRITAIESRALGLHVNFAPVADVNNNPRNPVINIRSFGEDPDRVGDMVAAWTRGLAAGGMLATLKHFPGHGDTDVDSHLGLPVISHPRERLDRLELAPFRAGLAAGAAGVMVAHIELPELDAARVPATFSRPVVTGLLRDALHFDGIVYSDAMRMDAISAIAAPGEAAVRAAEAGIDAIIDSPDSMAAVGALKAAVDEGRLPRARLEASARRVLEAKARLGLHRTRAVKLDAVPLAVGGRAHESIAREVSERALTLVKDERGQVPLALPRQASVLYLSVLDYPTNWRTGAPSRTFIPELRARWPDVEAIELSDRSTPNELQLVDTLAARFDAILIGVFVRAASASGRLDLAPAVERTLQNVARRAATRSQPVVAVFFGSPYAALGVRELPAMLFT
ncbi:MAG: glycoside hydrolase family 3 protein, partial [Acidobacteria bacterium]|nr:glycoside hydrolase family 3 protein [Acidobacteriota bacterium]